MLGTIADCRPVAGGAVARGLGLALLLALSACGTEPAQNHDRVSPQGEGTQSQGTQGQGTQGQGTMNEAPRDPSGQNEANPTTMSEPMEESAPTSPSEGSPTPTPHTVAAATSPATEVVTLGAGCFWCVEAVYEQLDGVKSAVSGYMGGTVERPTYEQVCGKKTGHVEVVQVEFDPQVIAFADVLSWFWRLHDPTSWDRQGADAGPQYRSVIFFHTPEQERVARESMAAAQASFAKPIVTEVRAASAFWPAEGYHQGYYFENQRNGYCRQVIAPKLEKLGLEK
ncbi:MAG: peptide-methionine (S)-S-oxide reductase MsrA [Planctomycetota bacterium]